MKQIRDVSALMVIAAAALLVALPFASGERVLFPFHTGAIAPWSSSAPEWVKDEPKNLVMSDKHAIIHPDLVFTRSEFDAGRVPLWNPHQFAGLPHEANPLTRVFYPPNLIFALTGPLRGYGISLALHLFLAASFGYLFGRTIALSRPAALFGGLAFAFGGWMSVHAQHAYFVDTMVWLPLVLASVERILRDRPRWALMGLSVGIGMMFLAGFPQTAVINCYLALAWGLVGLARRELAVFRREGAEGLIDDSLRRGGALLVFALLGLALAAVQLGPTLDFKERVGHQDLSVADLQSNALAPLSLLHLVSPDVFGSPTDSYLTDVLEILALGDDAHHVTSNYSERSFFPGLLALVLALLAPFLRRDRVVLTLGLAAAAGIAIALGGPILHLTSRLPGLDFGSPMRFTQLAAFALPMLAATSLDRLLELARSGHPRLLSRSLIAAAVLLGPLLIAMIAAWVAPSWLNRHWTDFLLDQGIDERFGIVGASRKTLEAMASEPFRQLRFAGTATLVFGALATLFFAAVAHPRTGRRLALGIAFLATLGELAFFGVRFNPPVRAEGLYATPAPVLDALREAAGDGRFIRFGAGTTPWYFSPNAPMLLGLNDAQGFRAMAPRRYLDLMRTVEPNPYDFGLPALTDPTSLEAPQLDLLRIRAAISPAPIPGATWPLVHPATPETPADGYVYANPRPPIERVVLRHEVVVLPPDAVLAEMRSLRERGDRETLLRRVYLNELRPGMRSHYAAPTRPELPVIVEDRPGRLTIEVDTDSGGVLVLSEQWDPGWTAVVSPLETPAGSAVPRRVEVLPADHALIGVPVEPGRHRVELRFEPTSFRWGGLISGFVLVFLLLVPVLPFLRVRRSESGYLESPTRRG
ncbi:MAG: YfhO family protein [Planctomycetota bacterium]